MSTVGRRKGSQWRNSRYRDLCQRDGQECRRCGEPWQRIWRRAGTSVSYEGYRYTIVNPSTNLEVDHLVALHLGGTNDLDNLSLLCTECHKVKTAAERSGEVVIFFKSWVAELTGVPF